MAYFQHHKSILTNYMFISESKCSQKIKSMEIWNDICELISVIWWQCWLGWKQFFGKHIFSRFSEYSIKMWVTTFVLIHSNNSQIHKRNVYETCVFRSYSHLPGRWYKIVQNVRITTNKTGDSSEGLFYVNFFFVAFFVTLTFRLCVFHFFFFSYGGFCWCFHHYFRLLWLFFSLLISGV